MREVVIVGAVRTRIGSHGGALRDLTAQELARIVMVAALEGTGLEPEQIDEAIVRFGMPMGPLWMADEIGPDRVPEGQESLEARHGARFRSSRLLRLKVRAGQVGVKTGRGFLEHPGQDRGQDG